ncbi:MAG: hypothetical protein HZA04_08775 [Nitrospinae bacterium]|nr:hypothetical protein [Nitrospinota bacterium]
MDTLMSIVIFFHVIAATMFAMTLIIMQLVVSPALAKIPGGPEKEAASAVIQNRWHPIVDTVIIILDITGLILLLTRWHLIGTNIILHVKVTFGIIALLCANLLHFYYRGYKRKLKAQGNVERLAAINRLTEILEKTALITGVLAFISGITFNHSPF